MRGPTFSPCPAAQRFSSHGGQWLGRLGADLGAALAAEAEPLLRALLDDSARLLDGGHGALWPRSSVALTSLLAAAAPLGLGLGLGPPSGQGSSPLTTAAEVDALRAEMDSLRAEIQVLRSQSSSQLGIGGTSSDLAQRLQQAEVSRRNRSPLHLPGILTFIHTCNPSELFIRDELPNR